MADKPGFDLDGRFYPFADNHTMGDAVLINLLTGMDGEEYAELLAEASAEMDEIAAAREADGPQPISVAAKDARVMLGLVGIAFWRGHPSWSVTRVARHVQGMDISRLTFHGGADDEDGGAETPTSAPTLELVEPTSAGASDEPSGRPSADDSAVLPEKTPEVTGHPA